MKNKIQTKLFILLLSGLLSACAKQGVVCIDSNDDIWADHSSQKYMLVNQQCIERLTGKMIHIPAGAFQMGSKGISRSEKPAHHVYLKAFKISQHEVTQKQWQVIMGNTPSHFQGCDNCPVDQVSWKDIQKFLKNLNQQTGQAFRLPSEAEWEYACRGGRKEQKYCGGNNESELAWYNGNSENKTHPVKQKNANGFGLYDMSGNVREWTQDCWNNSYSGAPANGSAWRSGNCKGRVVRGGSWIAISSNLRSAARGWADADVRSYNFGFRVVQE